MPNVFPNFEEWWRREEERQERWRVYPSPSGGFCVDRGRAEPAHWDDSPGQVVHVLEPSFSPLEAAVRMAEEEQESRRTEESVISDERKLELGIGDLAENEREAPMNHPSYRETVVGEMHTATAVSRRVERLFGEAQDHRRMYGISSNEAQPQLLKVDLSLPVTEEVLNVDTS